MVFPLLLGAGLASAALGFAGARSSAKSNERAARQQSESQAALAREILAASKPNIGEEPLYNLLMKQGQQGYDQSVGKQTAQLLRTGRRTGTNYNPIISDMMGQYGSRWQDRSTDARLSAIKGVMPSPQGLSAYGNLMGNSINSNTAAATQPNAMTTGANAIGLLGGLFDNRPMQFNPYSSQQQSNPWAAAQNQGLS